MSAGWLGGGCRPPGERERGSVTIVALGVAAIIVLAGMAATDVGVLAAGHARAQRAADLSALAALAPGGPPGSRAGQVARGNGATLTSCRCSAAQAIVDVRVRVLLLPAGWPVALHARARAVQETPSG